MRQRQLPHTSCSCFWVRRRGPGWGGGRAGELTAPLYISLQMQVPAWIRQKWQTRRNQPAASFSSLPADLVQDILRHLDFKGQGRAACVSKLCAAAVLPLAPALAHYVTAGDAPAVRRLLQKPDARLGLDNPSCEQGRTPLLAAVVEGNAEIFAALLEAGAATKARNTVGRTALITAAEWGRFNGGGVHGGGRSAGG